MMAANQTSIILSAEDRTRAAFASAKSGLAGLQSAGAKVNAVLATLGVGALAGGGLVAFVKSSIDAADNINDLSQKIGVSVETLAGYKLAAEQSGTSLEGMGNAARFLNKNIAEQDPLLKKLGISAGDANGALVQLAGVFASMPDGAQKTAIAMKLMGKSGADMIPLLNGGSAALEKMLEDGKKLYPITAEMARAADQFNDELAKLKISAEGAGIAIAGPLTKAMNDSIEVARRTGQEYGSLIGILAGFGKIIAAPFELTNSEKAIELQKKRFELIDRIEKIKASSGSADVKSAGITALQSELKTLGKELDEVFKKDKLKLLSKGELKAAAAKTISDNETAKRLKGLDFGVDKTAKTAKDKLDLIDPFGKERTAAELAAIKAISAAEADRFDLALELEDQRVASETREAQTMEALRKEYIDILDPIQKYRDKLDEVDTLVEAGMLNADQAASARLYWQEQIDAAAGFGAEMKKVASEMDLFWEEAAKGMQSSLADFLFDPFKEGTDGLLKNFASMLQRMAAEAVAADITRAIFGNASSSGGGQNILGGVAELFGFANGGAPGGVSAWRNQIVNKPTLFAFANGGIMGEAGPEAIMPLSRGSDGRLGVQANGGGGNITVNFQVTSPDAASFRKSSGQIQADLARAVQGARRFS